jgi:hypothetical protein
VHKSNLFQTQFFFNKGNPVCQPWPLQGSSLHCGDAWTAGRPQSWLFPLPSCGRSPLGRDRDRQTPPKFNSHVPTWHEQLQVLGLVIRWKICPFNILNSCSTLQHFGLFVVNIILLWPN